ncbi:glycosyltransferase [Lederbergia sp. NSJ-179]|uniref:glycosyltransferase family 2 protein n=1 Tax=Lederbergia sp. NSJ-179 TaxID=2931402 RepID=UPI001FD20AD1|nr:glycosyltransferase family 2 protein [Lederbergia sp. NSJ-179]MCJ7841366.1 glycosyltransferase [Lederbergia sp. NSJ-179]
MEPKVSIILTSYNKPQLLAKAIESVQQQTMYEWELWIMDDHSNEETVQTIQQYVDDPRIMYRNSLVEQKERYQTTRYASLINEAIPLTKGNYLTYLTDDTVYMPTRLSEMVAFLEENSAIDIVYSSQQIQVVNEQMTCLRQFTREAVDIQSDAADRVDHCSVMHTRKILDQVWEKFGGYWDDDPLHWCRGDAVFWQRLNAFQPFYPLTKVLDITYKTPYSVQSLFRYLPATIPDGMLVKGTGEEIYLIDEGKRRHLIPAMFSFFKYDLKKIVDVPDPLLYRLEEGIPIAHTSHLPPYRLYQDEEGDVFYLEQKQRRKIISSLVWKKFHFHRKEVIKVDSKLLNNIPSGPDIDAHFSVPLLENRVYKNHIHYWLMANHSLHPIDKKVLERLKIDLDPIPIPRNIINQCEKGAPIVGEYL